MSAAGPQDEHVAAGAATSPAAGVRGERGVALVSAVRSLHARASHALAAALMIALGLSALTWYYAHALARPARTRAGVQESAASRARGEMALPSLGPMRAPVPVAASPAPPNAPTPPLPEALALGEAPARAGSPAVIPAAPGAAVVKRPGELAFARRLSGVVFVRESPAAASPGSAPPATATPAGGGPGAAAGLGALLVPTLAPAAQAQRSPDSRFLLPQGAFVDCTLETAIDSTLPGMTTCITAADTFGADGRVVLLERGSKLVGETRGQVSQGQARLFVLWTQARTPGGVIVPLDSPGTDELGRAGVGGEVQRHFWQRFGAAILISVIDGAVQAGVQAASASGGAVIYTPAGPQDALTGVLRDTASIAPTLTKRNGERIQVLVARDIDFRSVYDLRLTGTP